MTDNDLFNILICISVIGVCLSIVSIIKSIKEKDHQSAAVHFIAGLFGLVMYIAFLEIFIFMRCNL